MSMPKANKETTLTGRFHLVTIRRSRFPVGRGLESNPIQKEAEWLPYQTLAISGVEASPGLPLVVKISG